MKKYKKLKISLIAILIAATISGLVFAGYKYVKSKKSQNISSQEVSEETKKLSENRDVENAKSSENKNYNQNSTQSQTSPNKNIAVTITSTGQSGQTVFISATIDGATSGNCQLKLTKNDKKIEKNAVIGLQVSYYICKGFNIDVSEFQEKGEWEAIIEVIAPNGSGKSESRKIDVR